MTQHNNKNRTQHKNKVTDRDKKKCLNERRLSTLKLWQTHLESLSRPKSKPLIERSYLADNELNNKCHSR